MRKLYKSEEISQEAAEVTSEVEAVFILDREGVIRYRWVSGNPGVEPDYAEVETELGKLN